MHAYKTVFSINIAHVEIRVNSKPGYEPPSLAEQVHRTVAPAAGTPEAL